MTRRRAAAAAVAAFVALVVAGPRAPAAAAPDDDAFAVAARDVARADLRAEVDAVCADPTVACAAGPVDVACRPEVYRLLLERLALAARGLEVLDLERTGRYAIAPVDDQGTFTIDDGAGARATCLRAHAAPDALLVMARGTVDLPLLPEIHGTGVILVRYAPTPAGALRCRCEVRFRLQSRVLHLATAPVRAALGRALTEKLALLVASAAALAERVERDPWAVHAALERAGGCDPRDLAAFRAALFLR